ncbi:MAG: anhydro-N-acetylmuramic acid kinase [Acidobacteriaceae bacterium]|nr:anhydro-N-acetylmuramic acid kinase [Acidobacteriaceae bacterium]
MIPVSKPRSMIVAGVMSGTSADGVDVALCRIAPGLRKDDSPRIKLLCLLETKYPKAVRAEVLRIMEGQPATATEISRLNWRLGEIYATCVENACKTFATKVDLISCHGQTLQHEPSAVRHLGAPVRSTWQLGEAAVIAERLRCPVVSDLRPADLAAGGQGAPLVPMLDFCLFRSAKVNRILLNLGGIANLTAIPAASSLDQLLAFDTGPANMVVDHCVGLLFGRRFDRDGAIARRGRVLRPVVERLLRTPFFSAPPPKSCGREEFGTAFSTGLIELCRSAGGSDADIIATATALTAESILAATGAFIVPHFGKRATAPPRTKTELCVAGGGAHNSTLMAMLRDSFASLGVRVRPMEDLGVPAQAKEAVAFALLAWLTWHGQPGNVPAATGASRAAILGKVSFG